MSEDIENAIEYLKWSGKPKLDWEAPYQASLAKRAEVLKSSNDALKEENERMKDLIKSLVEDHDSLKAMVAELEAENNRLTALTDYYL